MTGRSVDVVKVGSARRVMKLAVVAALAGTLAGIGGLAAQQAPKKGAPAKKEAAAPQSAWVKLCEKGTFVAKDKSGKELKQDRDICLVHHERIDRDTGMVMVSAAIRRIDGADREHLMVMVPLGMNIGAGIRAVIYPKDLWEKAQKKEKIDDSKLKPIKLIYTICHPAGCTAEIEATPDVVKDLRAAGGMMVFAVNAGGQIIAFPVPGQGFGETYDGKPVDSKQYSEARTQLMKQIRERQQAMMEQYRKEQEAKQKQGGQAPPAKK
jgi:invasion protein IalB